MGSGCAVLHRLAQVWRDHVGVFLDILAQFGEFGSVFHARSFRRGLHCCWGKFESVFLWTNGFFTRTFPTSRDATLLVAPDDGGPDVGGV